MLLSLIHRRIEVLHPAGGALLLRLAGCLLLTGCGSGDLLLPRGVPTQLRAVSGDGQTALAGDPVPNPLVVETLDAAGVPVPGAVVVFQFVERVRGAQIAPPTPQTDASGRAKVQVTLGATAGDQPVEARLAEPERDLSVRFLLTAIQPNRGGGGDDDEGDDDPPPDDGASGGNGGSGGDDGGDDEPRGGGDDGDDDGGDRDGDRGDRDDEGGEGKDDDGGTGKGGGGKEEDRDNRGKGGDDDRDDRDRDDDGDDRGRDEDGDDRGRGN